MDRTEERIRQRILELAKLADKRQIMTYTDFLNLSERNIFYHTVQKVSGVTWKLFGGYAKAERQLAVFIPDALSLYGADAAQEPEFPIACLKIEPLNSRFAETLSHRDYLGALLNLGIDRSVTGDILTDGTNAYVFCLQKIADFLCGELTRVRHTAVMCRRYEGEIQEIPLRKERIQGTVASVRLDSLLSLAFKESRSSLVRFIEEGKVFVNGKCVTSNGCQIKELDLISARGLGRFQYLGVLSETKKGRFLVAVERYV